MAKQFQFKTYKKKSFDRIAKNKATGKKTYEDHLTKEQKEHAALVKWLQYLPELREALWFHPPNEGNRTPFEQYLWSIMGCVSGLSDFFFMESNNLYKGLIIEYKAEGVTVFKKDGTLRKNETLEAQKAFLDKMSARGYYAKFVIGKTAFMETIKWYFKIK